jgi:hypothetical protein
MRAEWIHVSIAIGLLLVRPLAAICEETPQAEAVSAGEMHGAGGWRSAEQAAAPAQQWNLDAVRFEDGKVRGRISVANSPVLREGNVEGTITGDRVSGQIVDDVGILLVQFTGVIEGDRFRGTYTDRTGEVGEWEWSGAPPVLGTATR